MKDISLHVLDIAQNSVRAGAKLVTVRIYEDAQRDTLTVKIEDDGCGMDEELLAHVTDPFTTTRTTRKVGLGIPLFKAGAEQSGGWFTILSQVGKGTTVTAVYQLSHIDRPPLGDIAESMHALIIDEHAPDFLYIHRVNGNEFVLDTREIKEKLGGLPLGEIEIAQWLREYLKQSIDEIYGGV